MSDALQAATATAVPQSLSGKHAGASSLRKMLDLEVVKVPGSTASSRKLAIFLRFLPKGTAWVLVAGRNLGANLPGTSPDAYAAMLKSKGCDCVIAESIAPEFERALKEYCIFPLTLYDRCSAMLIKADETVSLKENKDLFSDDEITRCLVRHRHVWIYVGYGKSVFATHNLSKDDVERFMDSSDPL